MNTPEQSKQQLKDAKRALKLCVDALDDVLRLKGPVSKKIAPAIVTAEKVTHGNSI